MTLSLCVPVLTFISSIRAKPKADQLQGGLQVKFYWHPAFHAACVICPPLAIGNFFQYQIAGDGKSSRGGGEKAADGVVKIVARKLNGSWSALVSAALSRVQSSFLFKAGGLADMFVYACAKINGRELNSMNSLVCPVKGCTMVGNVLILCFVSAPGHVSALQAPHTAIVATSSLEPFIQRHFQIPMSCGDASIGSRSSPFAQCLASLHVDVALGSVQSCSTHGHLRSGHDMLCWLQSIILQTQCCHTALDKSDAYMTMLGSCVQAS